MGRILSNINPEASLLLKPGLNGQPPRISPTREVIDQLNAHFQSSSSKGDFITFMYGVLDRETGRFTYTRAGHPAPIIVSNGSIVKIGDKGDIPIGILPNYKYMENELYLKSGDRIFFYTDGIPEATNKEGLRFGEETMSGFLSGASVSSIDDSISGLMRTVMEWQGDSPPTDDMSILGFEVRI